ncbi:MAG: DUF6497 family protein [Pseudomonadota bacterium]
MSARLSVGYGRQHLDWSAVTGLGLAVVATLAVSPAGVFDVPSEEKVELYEVLVDQVGSETWLRFRFLVPSIARIGGTATFEEIEQDFEYLCREVALPYMAAYALEADVVVVSLLDRPVAFGSADAQATQFIDTFRVTTGACEWEGSW